MEKPQSPKVKDATMVVASRRIFGGSSEVFKPNLVLDSGASEYVVNAEALLFTIQPVPSRCIARGNGHTVSTTSVGDMRLCTTPTDGKISSVRRIVILTDVLYVPGLMKILVSVSCLANYGYTIRIGYHGECSTMKEGVRYIYRVIRLIPSTISMP